MTTSTAPAFTIGQQLVFATGDTATVVGLQPAPFPSVYLRGSTGHVWQDTPRSIANRIAPVEFAGWSTPGVSL